MAVNNIIVVVNEHPHLSCSKLHFDIAIVARVKRFQFYIQGLTLVYPISLVAVKLNRQQI